MQQLLGLVRLGRDVRSLAELQHRLLRGRPVAAGAGDDPPLVPETGSRLVERRLDRIRQPRDVVAVERVERRDRAGVARRVAPATARPPASPRSPRRRARRVGSSGLAVTSQTRRRTRAQPRASAPSRPRARRRRGCRPPAVAAPPRAPAQPSRPSGRRGTTCRSRCGRTRRRAGAVGRDRAQPLRLREDRCRVSSPATGAACHRVCSPGKWVPQGLRKEVTLLLYPVGTSRDHSVRRRFHGPLALHPGRHRRPRVRDHVLHGRSRRPQPRRLVVATPF